MCLPSPSLGFRLGVDDNDEGVFVVGVGRLEVGEGRDKVARETPRVTRTTANCGMCVLFERKGFEPESGYVTSLGRRKEGDNAQLADGYIVCS